MSDSVDAITPVLREALAAFEVWRKMGYPAEQIFFACDRDGYIAMILRPDKVTFTYACGRTKMTREEATAAWAKAAEIWNTGLTGDERKHIYESSYIRKNVVGLLAGMTRKGLRVKKPD